MKQKRSVRFKMKNGQVGWRKEPSTFAKYAKHDDSTSCRDLYQNAMKLICDEGDKLYAKSINNWWSSGKMI